MLRELELKANSITIAEAAESATVDLPDFAHAALRPKPSADEICRLYRDWTVQNEYTFREKRTLEFHADPDALLRGELLPLPPNDEITQIRDYPYEVLVAAYRYRLVKRLRAAKVVAVAQDVHQYVWFLKHLSEDMGYERVPEDLNLLAALARTEIKVVEEMIADDAAVLAGGMLADQHEAETSPKLSTVCDAYFAAHEGLSVSYADAMNATLRDFREVVGNRPVISYGRPDAAAFKEVLLTLPANWRKKKVLRELGIVEAAQKAKELSLPRQSAKTIKEKWVHLGRIFEHAQHNHDGVTNAFHAKSLSVSDNIPANEQKLPFSREELKALLGSELKGNLFWLTWLGTYTGARLNELCQLRKEHIQRHGDLHYIHFSRELQLKTGETESCVRAVPVHSVLIKLGFLDYVAEGTGPLFPGLVKSKKNGRLSDAPSKRFSYHLKKIGIKKDRLSYHSLRHSFIGVLKKAAPRDVETRERLVGHAVAGVAGRYGGSYEAEAADMELLVERARVIELVRFEGIPRTD